MIVDNAVATVQPAADAKGVRIQTIVDPRVGPVSGDPGRLQQVVWNLVSNAVKFTPKNGRVQVRLERVNSHVEIVVSDTGIGHPAGLPAVRVRAVSPGRGGHDAKDRRPRTRPGHRPPHRRNARRHGRGLERRRRARRDVPRAAAADDRASRRAVETRREHPRTERREALTDSGICSGIRVLAIDDEEDALTLLRVVLEAAGAEVTTLHSPLTALERIAEVKPHVLVVDLGMPEMDGFELITADPTIEGRGHSKSSGRGPDGVRAIGGSDESVAKRLRDASRQAGRSRRARRIGRDAGPAGKLPELGHAVVRFSRMR